MFREVDGVRYATPGDRARVLADGSIELLGRGSACINTGGEKVYPEEVEQVLRDHPAVRRRGGGRGPRRAMGRDGHRARRGGAGRAPVDDSLREHARDHLAGYKVPKRFLAVETLAADGRGQARLPACCARSRWSSPMPDACLPDGGVRSIPALAQWAAARYGDAEAVVDGETRLTFRELAALARRATRAAIAQGIEPGRPGRDLGAELVGVDRGRARRARGRAPGSCRSTPGSRATRRRTCSTGPARARCSPCAGSSTPTTSPCSATPRRAAVPRPRSCCCAGAARRTSPTFDDFLAAGDAIDEADAARPHRRARARRRRRRDLHVGHHRPAQGRDARTRRVARARSTCGRGGSACARATATSW